MNADFERIPRKLRAQLEAEAEASKAIAHANRRPQPQCAALSPSRVEQRLGLRHAFLGEAAPPYPAGFGRYSLHHDDLANKPVLPPSEFPLRESTVASAVSQQHGGAGMVKTAKQWQSTSTVIATGHDMPEDISYPVVCGALCRSTTTQRMRNLHAQVLKALLQLVSSACSGRKLACALDADLIIVAEKRKAEEAGVEGTPADELLFVAVGSASGRQAHHPEHVGMTLLQPARGQAPPPSVPRRPTLLRPPHARSPQLVLHPPHTHQHQRDPDPDPPARQPVTVTAGSRQLVGTTGSS